VKSRKFSFNYANLQRVPHENGIYTLWCNRICIYVGKAQASTLNRRLHDHYLRSHNEHLRLWINSSCTLIFQYETVRNILAIPAKERNRIRQLAPLTNVHYVQKRRS
jgi:excinuclease UvrABC nuclease subunit